MFIIVFVVFCYVNFGITVSDSAGQSRKKYFIRARFMHRQHSQYRRNFWGVADVATFSTYDAKIPMIKSVLVLVFKLAAFPPFLETEIQNNNINTSEYHGFF